jgi:hypothetical protein
MTQITFLCIVINPDTPLQDVIDSFSDLFSPDTCAGLPNLESLMIASAAPLPGLLAAFTELLETVNNSSPKLASLYLENVSKEFILGARGRAFWFDLRRITLKGEFLPLHLTTFDGCDALEFLSFTGELLATGDDALPPRVVRRCISPASSSKSSTSATTTQDADISSSNSTTSANNDNNNSSDVAYYPPVSATPNLEHLPPHSSQLITLKLTIHLFTNRTGAIAVFASRNFNGSA